MDQPGSDEPGLDERGLNDEQADEDYGEEYNGYDGYDGYVGLERYEDVPAPRRRFPDFIRPAGHTGKQHTRQQSERLQTQVKRSWPEPPEKGERRIVSANYSAVEIHGFFGLIDDGSVGAGRMLIVHVPKWIRGYFLDIKQGDTLHVYHAKGKKVGGTLTVLSTGRHKYYAPGRRVTTCTVCVPEEEWAQFA